MSNSEVTREANQHKLGNYLINMSYLGMITLFLGALTYGMFSGHDEIVVAVFMIGAFFVAPLYIAACEMTRSYWLS